MSTISASTTTTTAYKITADTTGALVLQTGSGPTTAVTIDTSQNVGIGTSSPTGKLHVIGASKFNAGNGVINLTADGTGALIGTSDAVKLQFMTGGITAATIDTSGNLLVGTTSSAKGSSGSIFSAGSAQENIRLNGTNPQTFVTFNISGSTVGSISANATTTTYATSSDYRLKENVQPMTGALSTVAALKPCTYSWKLDGSSGQGFIAHELQEVVPDAVTGEKDATAIEQYEITPAVPATFDEEGNELTPAVEAVMGEREVPIYQGIDTSFLVATLTAAIQEQQAIITTLTERITALEAK